MRKIPSYRFTQENSSDCNRLFLWQAISKPPFMGVAAGWKIIGYGDAPWFKKDTPIAVMFEKVTPPSGYGTMRGEDVDEGTQIWQHGCERWVPGLPEYERWLEKLDK